MTHKTESKIFHELLTDHLEVRNHQGRTPLWLAVSNNYDKLAEFLIEAKHADTSVSDVKNHCLVMAAVKNNAPKTLRLVLKHGCNPDGNENVHADDLGNIIDDENAQEEQHDFR